MAQQYWDRQVSLVLYSGSSGLDLSDMHIQFHIESADFETPNTAVIRVWNLADSTILALKEFNQVTLNAGYVNAAFGIVFQGTIRQFKVGHEEAHSKYLDIIASDGDLPYNWGISNTSLPAGSTQQDAINQAAKDMGLTVSQIAAAPGENTNVGGVVLPRGRVLFGLSRHILRNASGSIGASWSIQNGKVQVIPLQGYLPLEAVVLNGRNGMIGFPEQTDQGIKVRSLLNPKILVGGRIKIDNKSINQTYNQTDLVPGAPNILVPIQVNQAPETVALTTAHDGIYRVFTVDHTGDTRGQDWYTDVVCLMIDQTTGLVEATQ